MDGNGWEIHLEGPLARVRRASRGEEGPGAWEMEALRSAYDLGDGLRWRRAGQLRSLDLAHMVKAFGRSGMVGLDSGRCTEVMASYAEHEPLPAEEVAALPLILRAERLGKVLGMVSTFLRKRSEGWPPGRKDVLDVLDLAELETERLRWLEREERGLLAVFGGSQMA